MRAVEQYFDIYDCEAYEDLRCGELDRHLHLIEKKLGVNWEEVEKVLEIGPGCGAEPRFLREKFPNSQLVAVDSDARAKAAVLKWGGIFYQFDVAERNGASEVRQLAEGADLVLALRTSLEVVEQLQEIALITDALVVASLIMIVEEERKFYHRLLQQETPPVFLEDRRGLHEFAFLIS